jgi:hypothetical protein
LGIVPGKIACLVGTGITITAEAEEGAFWEAEAAEEYSGAETTAPDQIMGPAREAVADYSVDLADPEAECPKIWEKY